MHDLVRLLLILAGLGAGSWSAASAYRLQHRSVAVTGVARIARRIGAGWSTEVQYTDAAGSPCTGRVTGRRPEGTTVPLRYADLWRHRAIAPVSTAWPYAEPVCILITSGLAIGLTYLI